MKRQSTLTVLLAATSLVSWSAVKETPPAGAPAKPFKLAATDDFTLPNGMRVTLAPYGVVPRVAIRVYVDAGELREPANQVWVSKLAALLLKEGTAKRSAQQIAQEAADMGGQLEITSGSDSTVAGGVVLSEFAPRFVTLLADVLANPALPSGEFTRLKADLTRELAVEKAEPGSLARERFLGVMFPNQPYGRTYPSAEALADLKLADVQSFVAGNFAAARSHLYVVGKFDPGVKETIKQAFADWKPGEATSLPAPKPVAEYSLQQIDRPGAAQSTVIVGLPMPGPKAADYVTLGVVNSLLGGSFGSRITTNIRENKGYTYSPYSFIGRAGHEAYWSENADVTTAVTGPSLHEIFLEINRLRKDPPSEKELKGIQNYLAGNFVLRNTISPDAVISQLHFVDSQELDRSYLFTYVQKVVAVSTGDIQRVAETYLSPSKMTVVVVGDQSKTAGQLSEFQSAPH